MVNKLLIFPLLLFTFVACNGTKVDFTEPKVEKIQFVTDGEGITEPTSMNGTLIRPSVNDGTDKVILNGQTYQVGKYSSAGAYSFIYSKALGSQTAVKVSGKTGVDKGYAPNPEASIKVITLETILPQ